ncbi:MAG: nuclease domain-containing protein, partial [Flavobacteriaceae bacterium]
MHSYKPFCFGKSSKTIKSWTTVQKPDIYLEAEFPDKEKIVWLFDAKYRVEEKEVNGRAMDLVPDDAIN